MWPLLLSLPLAAPAQEALPPRRDLLAAPVRRDVRLSPDGTLVGWLEPDEAGVAQLRRAPVDEPAEVTALTDGSRAVLEWRWAHSNEHVLFTREVESGDVHLFVGPRERGSLFDVTPDAVGATHLAGHGRQWPTHVALDYRPDEEERGLWLLDFVSKERHRMCDGGFERYVFDGNMWPAGASGPTPDGFQVARMQPSGEWKTLATLDWTGAKVAGVVAADFGGGFLFHVGTGERGDRDRTGLWALELEGGRHTLLAEHPRADLLPRGVQVDARTRMPVTLVADRGVLERVEVDPLALARLVGSEEPVTSPVAADWTRLEEALAGELELAGQDRGGRRWLIARVTGGPRVYHLYDRESGEVRRLFGEVPALEDLDPPTRRPFPVRARDGRELPCHLVLPPGAGDEPLPAVVFVHGGPWGLPGDRSWSARRHLALLATRGYAVVAAEFRGAVGHGRTWVDEGDGELGAGMIDDVLDAAAAAVEEGVAREDALGILGRSYGGFAVLRALTREPERFTCGVALQPMADLLAQQEARQDDPDWRALWNRRVGDPGTDEGRALLEGQSPLHDAGALTAPLLLTHGGLDLVIPKEQADAFARAAHAAGAPVTYLVYRTEPHDYRAGARVSFWAAAERFLAEHLGGRYEPYGEDLRSAEVVVAVGGERVPGLEEE